jgi:hypothetical protein
LGCLGDLVGLGRASVLGPFVVRGRLVDLNGTHLDRGWGVSVGFEAVEDLLSPGLDIAL